MRLAPAALLLSSALLAACQSPREACLSGASRDLRTVDSLIRETQGNLQRGYAIEIEQDIDVIRTTCEVELPDGTEGRVLCDRTDVDEVRRPVAIDLNAERAKLDSLLEQRGRLLGRQEAQVAACVAAYPE